MSTGLGAAGGGTVRGGGRAAGGGGDAAGGRGMARGGAAVGRCLDRADAYLAARGIPASRLEARVLLAHCTGLRPEEIPVHPERPLTLAQVAAFHRLVVRRGKRREPLQYLTGEAEFYSRQFYVNKNVLIPRPETEVLVEEAVRRLAGVEGPLVLADLGTGSGVLAVTMALELPGAVVHAVDVSPGALAVAVENARRHGVVERIRFHEGDLWNPLAAAGLTGALAGVVSNPPYVAEGELAWLQPEVRLHEPREALVAGEGGLAFYRRIAAAARLFLRPGGWLLVEVGAGQAAAVAGLFKTAGLVEIGARRDFAGHDRVVMGRAPSARGRHSRVGQ